MAYEFLLPDIGEGLAEAVIVEWRVAVGDTVTMDQIVVDVETDKAVVEIPIPVAGTILHLGGEAGDTIEVGSVLVVVGEADEEWPGGSDQAAPIVGTLDSEVTMLEATARQESSTGGGARALPVVRKLAKDLGVDLDSLQGTGPDGRITRDDVTAAAGSGAEPADVVEEEPVVGSGRPMSNVRKAIAERMSRSWAEIPHVTTFDEVDATRLLEVKKALTRRTGIAISIDALVVKAVVPVLVARPDFNARLEGVTLVDPDSFDIGVAVDTPDGLIVVVVRDAASRTLGELATEMSRLATAAKERKATPRELTGQTFTVSNIGAVGGGYGTPIIPVGTTAILSVGRAVDRPVARDGNVVIAPMMPLSLSYDHRVIDGGAGRRFLAHIVENLTEPALFLAE